MQRSAMFIVSLLIAGILTGTVGTRVLPAQPQGVKRLPLLQRDLSGIDGQEAVMFVAEIAPAPRAVATTTQEQKSRISCPGRVSWKSRAKGLANSKRALTP